MKNIGLPLLFGALTLLGCSGPSASFRQVPPGYYRVEGKVCRPGLVKCGDSEKSLTSVIKEAGGFTTESYLKKIEVSHAGSTNSFDGRKILNHESEDPRLQCGSTIYVRDNMF